MPLPAGLQYSEPVRQALTHGDPVVALESSVIAQGLPRPHNLEAALRIERAVCEAGAAPATLAVLDGDIHVGLDSDGLKRIAQATGVEKGGTRDLARAVACGLSMATTVASSVAISRRAGIGVLATGGIGGVHRDAAQTMDISHDLHALASTPCVTVCSGIKSILDLPRTLELMETLGIPIVGWATGILPDFYAIDSGFKVPSCPDPSTLARMFRAQLEMGLQVAIVVVNPPPAELAFSRPELDDLVGKAEGAARAAGVTGKEVTPFLLAHIASRTAGRSIALNIALLESNARVAAAIAGALRG